MTDKIRIMVVDDTITYRQILSKVVESFEQTELVGSASSGKTALMKIASLKPDLIFLDVMMPEMDGIETLQHLKKDYPGIQVVMVSAFDMENAKATLQSLDNGALDFIAKPVATNMQEGVQTLSDALRPLIELVHHQVYGKRKKELAPAAPAQAAPAPSRFVSTEVKAIQGKVDFVLIGISTGGPNALQVLFEGLRGKIDCPVLIVQHMPPMFTQSLAERLDAIGNMKVQEAKDDQEPLAGHVYIAPGGKHMLLQKKGLQYRLHIADTPPVNHCKPAVDVLFRSAAGISDIKTLSVVMTGMGRDGTEGVKALKRQGTYSIIQDEASSVVWGMPGSVHEAGAFDEMLSLKAIGPRLIELTRH